MTAKDTLKNKYYDRFGLLLAVATVTVTLLLLVDLNQEEGLSEALAITVTVLTAAMLLIAVNASGVGRKGTRLARIVVGITISASVIGAFASVSEVTHGGFIWLALVIAAPLVALRRLLHHREVTVETVFGAVAVYLLMAIAATYLFLFIDLYTADRGGFFGEPEPTTVFMYFSLVTLTTLGYGDFFPTGVVGRAGAAGMAVVGQIYLVVVVAYVVSVYTSTRKRPLDTSSVDDG